MPKDIPEITPRVETDHLGTILIQTGVVTAEVASDLLRVEDVCTLRAQGARLVL